jgi:hypothetical protein
MLARRLIDAIVTGRLVRATTTVSIPTNADFAEMILARRRDLHGATRRLVQGAINLDDWFDLFEATLLEGHTASWQMGRHLAGDLEDDINDLLRGMAARDAESYYLRGFLDALRARDPRYWDDENAAWDEGAIRARQDMYLGKMRGTANQAFVDHTPSELDEWWWIMSANEDHCAECPELQDLSPFTRDTLFTVPGASDTPCMYNCLCYLKRGDGRRGFDRVEL